MTIKEVEEQTGLTRSNIRFYEKEKLIEPSRNDKNGYRDYSEKVFLIEIIEKQTATIQEQIEGLNKAKIMCERMLEAGNISFDELQVEKYVTDLQAYFNDNKTIFKLDSVSFLYIWVASLHG